MDSSPLPPITASLDPFNREVLRVAQAIAFGAEPSEVTEDFLMAKASEVYLMFRDAEESVTPSMEPAEPTEPAL